jgi:restriction system protein
MHDPDKSNMTEVGYRLAWARTYLRKYGLLENSSRGVWSLTAKGNSADKINAAEIVKAVRNMDRPEPTKRTQKTESSELDFGKDLPEEDRWKDKLNAVLTQQLSPQGFERLVQRILRESGFVAVEVTGRTGDGGIDGKGIARINGFMSFHVLFQCKRYKGSVAPAKSATFGVPWSAGQTKGFSSPRAPSLLALSKKLHAMVLHRLTWWMVMSWPKS